MAMRRRQPMGLAAFLGHSTRGEGGGNRLKNWKDDGHIVVWLHTMASFAAVWRHSIPRIVTREDKESKDKWQEVWPGDWNCLEHEDVLKEQYRRKDGERVTPPEICPECRFIEEIRRQVTDGELSIAAPVLQFKIRGPKANDAKVGSRTLSAGGLFNAFSESNQKNLTAKQKREMKRAGIKLTEAWKENQYAKCGYIFVVVNHDDVASGIQIAEETTLLGDLMKEAIRDRMTSEGEDDGNPMKKPIAFRWEYRAREKQFNKKYKVIPMTKMKLTKNIRELIYDTDPPDIARMLAPGNVKTLRAQLEAALCDGIEIDFDEIFGPAEELMDENGVIGDDAGDDVDDDTEPGEGGINALRGDEDEDEDEDEAPESEEPEDDDEDEEPPESEEPEEPEEEDDEEPEDDDEDEEPESEEPEDDDSEEEDDEEPEDDDEIVACSECGEDMKLSETTCPHCGAEYDDEGNVIKKKAPAKKKRSKKAAAKKAPAKKASKKKASSKKGGDAGEGDDDLPF